MTTLEDLIKLCGEDSGKVFVVNDQGDVQLVIMGAGEYQKMLVAKVAQQLADIEDINKQITQAQMEDLAEKKKELFKSVSADGPIVRQVPEPRDLRSEIIDPSFNFDAPDRYSADQPQQ